MVACRQMRLHFDQMQTFHAITLHCETVTDQFLGPQPCTFNDACTMDLHRCVTAHASHKQLPALHSYSIVDAFTVYREDSWKEYDICGEAIWLPDTAGPCRDFWWKSMLEYRMNCSNFLLVIVDKALAARERRSSGAGRCHS